MLIFLNEGALRTEISDCVTFQDIWVIFFLNLNILKFWKFRDGGPYVGVFVGVCEGDLCHFILINIYSVSMCRDARWRPGQVYWTGWTRMRIWVNNIMEIWEHYFYVEQQTISVRLWSVNKVVVDAVVRTMYNV